MGPTDKFRIQDNCQNINWNLIRDYLKIVGMGYHEPELHRKAFENSHTVMFVFHEEMLIGFGRAISDDAYQAAVYDIVVLPEYQKEGVGRLIMSEIIKRVSHCNIILYANPGKEEFYKKLGFSMLKTGMGLFLNPDAMKTKGMIG